MIITILINFTIFQVAIIVMLFLVEIGFFRRLYEEITTNPRTEMFTRAFGDVLYGVGISILGAVLFGFMTGAEGGSSPLSVITGLISLGMIIVGALWRKIK